MSEPTLWSRVLAGMRWTLLLRVLARSVGLVATLVVARVVPIGDLGAYGAILIADQALQALTQLGFTTALVQMQKDPTEYLDTAWTAQVVRSAAIYALEFALAPVWCAFFHVPEAVTPMRVLALGQLVLGFHSMSTAILMREMKFERLFFTYAAEALVHAAVTLGTAIVLRNVWAPVLGLLAGTSARVVVSYLVAPYRPRLRFDAAKAREMYRLTKWVGAYAVADFFLATTDNAVTGRVVGKVPLAHYRMAYQLATEGPLTLQWVVTSVAFPAFSSIQRDASRVRTSFRALLALVAVAMLPVCTAMVLLAEELVEVLLGSAWQPAVLPLQILASAGLLRAVIDTAPPVLRALASTRADFGLKLVQVFVLCALLYPAGTRFGVVGVAWSVVAAASVTLVPWALVLRRRVGLGAADFLLPFTSPFAAAALAVGVTALLPETAASWPSLLGRGAVFLATYAVTTRVLLRVAPGSGLGAILAARAAPASPPVASAAGGAAD